MPTNNWIRFLRNYGPIPTNDNMYDETIQRALARLKMQPIELPAQHLAWLVDNFRSDECQSIILTGTAGDGKTYHCRRAWLELGGTIEDWNAGEKIQRLALGSRQLIVVKDLSELRSDESKPLIEQMAWDVADANSPRVYLMAANHGQLLEKLKTAGSDKTTSALVEVVENLLVVGRSGNSSIRLDLRDLSRSAAAVMIDQVIDAVALHPGWDGCSDCPALSNGSCPIRENRDRLVGNNDNGLFRRRLGNLVEASEQNGGHFTIRQVLSLVTNIILGHPDARDGLMACTDVADLAAAGIAERASPYRNVFGGIGVQVLVIDEVHNILAGTYREQRIVLNTLRFLSNRLHISLVCFGVNEAREAISGDVQLARRFEQFTLNRWAANEQFETLVASILRNTPLRRPSVLTPKSLRRMLQITEGITANIFHMVNSLAIDAIENGSEQITNEAVEIWEPEFDAEAAFA